MLDVGADHQARAPAPAPFIVGVSRSGTTLLRLMLDAHPELAIPDETHVLGDLVADPDRLDKDAVVDAFVRAPTWPNMHLDANHLRAAVDRLDPFTVAGSIRAFYRLCAARTGKVRWGDKTPPYREHLEAIAGLLPEAHFVHLIRDGRDVALSFRGLWFGPGDDAGAAAAFWRDQVQMTREAGRRLPHYLEVRYEELVTEPERVLRDLCAFLELPFDPSMLQHERFAARRLGDLRASFGPWEQAPVPLERFVALHRRAGGPVDDTRVGRWRTEMTEAEVDVFGHVAGALLDELGYPPAREEGHPVG